MLGPYLRSRRGTGVPIPPKDLHPINHNGTTYESHRQLEDIVQGRVMAVDAVQWLFHSYEGNRCRTVQGKGPPIKAALIHSATTLTYDRVAQMLRYGMHPVIVFHRDLEHVEPGFIDPCMPCCLQVQDIPFGQPLPEKGRTVQSDYRPYRIYSVVQNLCMAMVRTPLRATSEDKHGIT